MTGGLQKHGGLLPVEAFGDGREFVFERDGLVDRRDTAGRREALEPVTQRGRRALRRPRGLRCAVRRGIA